MLIAWRLQGECMSIIIDRRLNGKNKSAVNRQRFMQRYRKSIKKSVSDAINKRSITDVESGSEISISQKDLSEPVFHHGNNGKYRMVHPGNKEFVKGDKIPRPNKNEGKGADSGKVGDKEGGIDDFIFQISHDEFIHMVFDNLELPNMALKQRKENIEYKKRHGGLVSEGPPNRLNVIQSLKAAHARRIALSGRTRKELKALKKELQLLELSSNEEEERLNQFNKQIQMLEANIKRLPFIDEFDLKFNNVVLEPQPSNQAVMFCLMDDSGSMTQDIKEKMDNNKSWDMNIHIPKIEAKEVEEDDFFYSRETGGTIVSSALILAKKIIKKSYPSNEWNIYVAQASDGDNWEGDSSVCKKVLINDLIPLVQYFSYVEITDRQHQNLWREYEEIQDEYPDLFAMEHIKSPSDIYPVFRKLFEKKETA